MTKKKSGRPQVSLKDNEKIKIWTEAAGRCQFRGCNTELWYNSLTLSNRNFSELAHIIGASEDGPRGNHQSTKLADDPNNIMLLCDRCHKEVDGTETRKLYPEDVLIKMKSEHNTRVRMLLDQKAKKTRPLILTAQIEKQNVMFADRSIQSAIYPDYLDTISDNWIRIEHGKFDRTKNAEWEVAKSRIEVEIEDVNRAVATGHLEHLSVFALAAQPLLMYLGSKLGDKAIMQVFEPRRTDDLDKKWTWEEEDGNGITYQDARIQEGEGTNVILLLALSDYLSEDKYTNMVAGNPHVYQLTIDKPVQGFLTKKSEKVAFIHSCRQLLNRIQKEVGRDSTIHVLPAMPASLAVEFGRLLQPTKDPKIWIYENVDKTVPKKIIELS
ncbi:MAG: SAVED domain-containing protein [Ekhidna sp.]|uniref:SAVED domain-containing protein n=1 Tax=Reichenbachiella sp. TaxID=2184521 RepID=UPI003265DA33